MLGRDQWLRSRPPACSHLCPSVAYLHRPRQEKANRVQHVKPRSFMVIAGETSGDILAAELVRAIRAELNRTRETLTWDYQPLRTSLDARFFGAGGPQMAAAGVDLALDMTTHAVTGISEVLRNYLKFRRLFAQLYQLALRRSPDAIICVDFSGFNRR